MLARLLFILWASLCASAALAAADQFPKPQSLVPAVTFWKKVYTQIETDSGYIHDRERLDKTYAKLTLKATDYRQQNKEIRQVLARYRNAFRALAKGKRTQLSKLERHLLTTWGKEADQKAFLRAAKNVRFQRGQADKFKAGLARSGAYLAMIQRTLRAQNLPTELAALPHVESSFNPAAHSHAGAAGLWQFTRSTGRRYMRIDHVVDERRDAEIATAAAAKLLKHNHENLGHWPLALTAYNHGLTGMKRAVKKTGSSDIGVIVQRYESRSFGFASKNFYASFLAALEISRDPKTYFGELTYERPVSRPQVTTTAFIPAKTLSQRLGVSLGQLKELNPALQATVWSGDKHIPKDYPLTLPTSRASDQWQLKLAKVAKIAGHDSQRRDRTYKVRRGDSLSTIAKRYGTSSTRLAALNNLRSRHRIRIGQVLKLPSSAGEAASSYRPTRYNYTVRRGDSLSTIASRHGLALGELLALNDLKRSSVILPGQKLILQTASPKAETYTVKRGDALAKIAKRHGMSLNSLLALNGLNRKSTIHPGQRLKISAN